jgi:hypothetical protein
VTVPGPGGTLTLDLSSHVGWAYGTGGPIPDSYGLWQLPQPTRGGRFNAFRSRLEDFIDQWAPSEILMEAPLPLPAQNNAGSARQQYGLAAYVEGECAQARIPVLERNVDDVRRLLIGRSRSRRGTGGPDLFGRPIQQGIKDMVIAYVRSLGLPVHDDNVADAIALYLALIAERRHARIRIAKAAA